MNLTHNLDDFDAWLTHSIKKLSPANARKLQRAIGAYLRKRTQQTMRAQTDPDGNAWEARKPQREFLSPEEFKNKDKGKHKAKKRQPKAMMRGLVKAKHLTLRLEGAQMKMGWFNTRDAIIARKHHFGEREKLPFGVANYPSRPMLGINDQDKVQIQQMMIEFLQGE